MAHVDVYILSPIFGITIYANCLILLKVRLLLCYKLQNKWSVVCFKFTVRFHRYLCSYIFFFSKISLRRLLDAYKTNYSRRKFFSFLLFIINLKYEKKEGNWWLRLEVKR